MIRLHRHASSTFATPLLIATSHEISHVISAVSCQRQEAAAWLKVAGVVAPASTVAAKAIALMKSVSNAMILRRLSVCARAWECRRVWQAGTQSNAVCTAGTVACVVTVTTKRVGRAAFLVTFETTYYRVVFSLPRKGDRRTLYVGEMLARADKVPGTSMLALCTCTCVLVLCA